jgi:hypothetical protein
MEDRNQGVTKTNYAPMQYLSISHLRWVER